MIKEDNQSSQLCHQLAGHRPWGHPSAGPFQSMVPKHLSIHLSKPASRAPRPHLRRLWPGSSLGSYTLHWPLIYGKEGNGDSHRVPSSPPPLPPSVGCPAPTPGPPNSLWKEEKQGSSAGHVLHAFITLSTSFCLKDRCRLKAQVSFIFLIKDVQRRF